MPQSVRSVCFLPCGRFFIYKQVPTFEGYVQVTTVFGVQALAVAGNDIHGNTSSYSLVAL